MILILLQAFQVVLLWVHDWVPLGRLNDVAAIRRQTTRAALLRITVIQSLPYTVGLIGSIAGAAAGHDPGWLHLYLWVSYGILFFGELNAWWRPYLLAPDPSRAERYRTLFGATHAVLPPRNGITPNTLHCLLHLATLATLIALALRPS